MSRVVFNWADIVLVGAVLDQLAAKNAQNLATTAERIARVIREWGMTLKTFPSHGVLENDEFAPLQIKRIVVPVDFSPASQAAFHHAVSIARRFASDLLVLYVVPPAPAAAVAAIDSAFGENDLSNGQGDLRALTRFAGSQGIENTRALVRTGVPAHEIVEAARDEKADLIVIATHGYTGWKHFCIGSTAECVVQTAPCPVLVVREKEYEFC